jgi:serine/threonine protein kinase
MAGDPSTSLTAEEVEPRADVPQHHSPSSAVCYMDADEAPAPAAHDFAPLHATSQQNTAVQHAESRAEGAEADSTPRSEEPAVSDAVNEMLMQHTSSLVAEPSYFSPQPLRVLPSKIPHANTSNEPSPTSSDAALDPPRSGSVASSWRATGPSPAPPPETGRPPYQRDLSNASTATTATMRPNSVDAALAYLPPQPREGPVYPNQSYAALQMQQHSTQTHYILRAKSSQPAHHSGYSMSHISTFGLPGEHYRGGLMDTGSRTVGNSPASSPGLFSPHEPLLRHNEQSDDNLYSGPWLHYTHRQAPKETHVADVDVDPMSGRKIINHYEILDELGRGMHGKVKLGRDLQSGATVAIKIIDRYSKRRRLGKNTSHEDKIKREIAILKKARHENIVGLLEVIDDPSKKKVYIILEHVSLGEVKWRKEGPKEICLVEWRRVQRESEGIFDNESAKMEDDAIIKLAHQKLQRQQRRQARKRRLMKMQETGNEAWSLELGGDSEDDYSDYEYSSRASAHGSDRPASRLTYSNRQGSSLSQDSAMETAFRADMPSNSAADETPAATGLEGTMYGAYDTEAFRGRVPSLAGSSSSHLTNGEDEVPEHFHYVPVMTIEKARAAFRDTVLGLEYLHFQNVIHRDIKPANLLMTATGRVKISDFGVSYLGSAPRQDSNGDQSESDAPEVDEAIELAKTVGTPAFYAPELCNTELDAEPYKIDKAIDVWALGVTLYCLIYGRVPFHDQNQFFLMKRITDDEPYIPTYRLKPVDDSGNSRPNSHGRMYLSSGDKRADHDLDYEAVDDHLRDLLQRLLIKDPRKRITIPDIKRHAWLMQGIDNADKWVKETEQQLEGNKIEISKEDIEKAVIPFGALFDKMRYTVTKIKDLTRSLTRRETKPRNRAQSTASGQDVPSLSTNSSSSTISQEGRRPSLGPGMSIYEALSKSRESEHPLSHSVTASPDTSIRSRYFEGANSRTASPAHITETREHPTPLTFGGRPRLPDRAHSTLSSAASIRTVRPTDWSVQGFPSSPGIPPALPGTPIALDTPGGSNLSGIYGGMPKRAVHDARSEEKRLVPPREVSRAKSIDRMFGSHDDPHSMASLAVSTDFASGHVDQPDLLKELSPTILGSSPQLSDMYAPSHLERAASRQSSLSSASSRLHKTWATNNDLDAGPLLDLGSVPAALPVARDTSEDGFSRAKDEFVRRRLREVELERQRTNSNSSQRRPSSALSQHECPPSPDDDAFYQHHQKVEEFLNHQQQPYATSPVTRPIITPAQLRPIMSSSSEEQFTCISQSTSNPSVPSVASATSSVALDEYVVSKMTPAASLGSIHINQFSTPTDDAAGYDGDHAVESEDEDSEEEFLVMGKKKPAPRPSRSESISNAELARSNVRKELGYRRRSNRSGSNGTVKKVPPGDS